MMLLDTCVLFWLEHSPGRISEQVTSELSNPATSFFASGISAFELGLKVRRQLIQLPLSPGPWIGEVCRRRNIVIIPVDERIAGASTELPEIHRDPCDRMLVATARLHKLTLATPDRKIHEYPDLSTCW